MITNTKGPTRVAALMGPFFDDNLYIKQKKLLGQGAKPYLHSEDNMLFTFHQHFIFKPH